MTSSHRNRQVDDARAIFHAAVRAVQADALLEGEDWDRVGSRKIGSYERVHVVGMGKAALAMASVLEAKLDRKITGGVIAVPEGYPASLPGHLRSPSRIQAIEAGHPLPDEGSRRAAERILEIATDAREGDLVIVLVSGGGSPLCADFAGEVTLDDAQETFRLLLSSGADIYAMNTVRKHISNVGGGRLAAAADPADVLALIVSDVVGDDLSMIASGPTVPDRSTYADAKHVLDDRSLWDRVPSSVRDVIERGRTSEPDAPHTGEPTYVARVTNRLLATNEVALRAGAAEAQKRGYDTEILSSDMTGEAREVGRYLIETALERNSERPLCLICGGETTVLVRGTGKGGRNQEMALSASLGMHGQHREVVFLSGGTDGIDGATDAAGAWCTPDTVQSGKKRGLDARDYLANNDSYTFFLHLDSLLKTGHTHTNVMDVQIILMDGVPRHSS